MTASYDYHIGVDYHKSYSHLVVQDSAGKTLRSGRVKNDRQSLGLFLERYRENSHAVVEATRNWMVIYDWLDDLCDDVVLAHPLKVKAIADAKIKTDKIDATVLAHLLRADLHHHANRRRDLWRIFFTVVLNFLILAWIVFLMVRMVNNLHRRLTAEKSAALLRRPPMLPCSPKFEISWHAVDGLRWHEEQPMIGSRPPAECSVRQARWLLGIVFVLAMVMTLFAILAG